MNCICCQREVTTANASENVRDACNTCDKVIRRHEAIEDYTDAEFAAKGLARRFNEPVWICANREGWKVSRPYQINDAPLFTVYPDGRVEAERAAPRQNLGLMPGNYTGD